MESATTRSFDVVEPTDTRKEGALRGYGTRRSPGEGAARVQQGDTRARTSFIASLAEQHSLHTHRQRRVELGENFRGLLLARSLSRTLGKPTTTSSSENLVGLHNDSTSAMFGVIELEEALVVADIDARMETGDVSVSLEVSETKDSDVFTLRVAHD